MKWKKITPDENNDWINIRNRNFQKLISLTPEFKGDMHTKSVFTNYFIGTVSSRDTWVYNYSNNKVKCNMNEMINYYNNEVE